MRATLRFLLLGLLLFALRSLGATLLGAAEGEPRDELIRVSREQVDSLRARHLAATGDLPEPADLERMIQAEVDREILLREARARGLGRHDPAVELRLLQKMRFVEPDSGLDATALLARARALGMHREDLVVRRILVERMRERLRRGEHDAAANAGANEAELQAYLERHVDRFALPERRDLVHVFVGRDRHGEQAAVTARGLLAELRAGAEPGSLGDPFDPGPRLRSRSRRQLASHFGVGFSVEIESLPEGRWSSPIASAYGLHLVRVEALHPALLPRLESVRSRVALALRAEREDARFERALEALRTRYVVRRELSGASGSRGRKS